MSVELYFEVACVIVGGVVLWMMLGMCILKSPLADALMTKETKGVSKVLAAQRVLNFSKCIAAQRVKHVLWMEIDCVLRSKASAALCLIP